MNAPIKRSRGDVQVPGATEPVIDITNQPADAGAPVGSNSAKLEPEVHAMREADEVRTQRINNAQVQQVAPEQTTAAPLQRHDYRNMRSAEIDHTKLTAPVLTKDGYLCPPAPAPK